MIATAPQRRLAIKTFVRNGRRTGVIREAVLRELKRGGQIYFLHNEVGRPLRTGATSCRNCCLRPCIAVAHGQMPERELARDARLRGTALQTCCCAPPSSKPALTCLGQHHHHQPGRQVRPGAVAPAAGRGALAPPGLCLFAGARCGRSDQASGTAPGGHPEHGRAGSGFYLAMHDLEIRCAGEVLGDSQSGNMMEVGFSSTTTCWPRPIAP